MPAGSVSRQPGSCSISSWTSEPRRRAASKPRPISTPFMAWIDMSAPARRPSSRRSQATWLPSPTGTPRATTSNTPPSVSPARRAASIASIIRRSASGSSVRNGESSTAAFRSTGSSAAGVAATSPSRTTWLPIVMPNSASRRFAMAPAATRAVVSRADARSRMSRASVRSYFRIPTRSACPGLGR